MLSGILPGLRRWHQMELRSHVAAWRSPTSPRAEVKVEGENRWLALTQALTTEPFSTLPNTTSLPPPLLAYFYAELAATSQTTGSGSAPRPAQTQKNWHSPPQCAECVCVCVSRCIKRHILRFSVTCYSARVDLQGSNRRGQRVKAQIGTDSVCVCARMCVSAGVKQQV